MMNDQWHMSWVSVAVIVFTIFAAFAWVMLQPHGHGMARARMENATRLRGIHQGVFQYAQSNDRKYPGLGDDAGAPFMGHTDSDSTTSRLARLMDDDYFTGDFLVSPLENLTVATTASALHADNYSYALLQISHADPDADAGRETEWADTARSTAIIASDRLIGTLKNPASVHSEDAWEGSVVWNDGHTSYERSIKVPETQYGDGPLLKNDHLFVAEGESDAMMVHGDGKDAKRRAR